MQLISSLGAYQSLADTFLKLASAESVFGISGIIRYRPHLPWSVLVRDRVCVRVRFP